ncbi:PTS system mannitol-specific IIA component [Streptosporangium becharense]|uniref:Mannitol-specific phosphotransferase enzyme IIA component n=1 Tax=Streptosporangium becharense TaxID=1816182 RepID=A0A7W9MEY6_9ACTN|nr:PTS sugar transporter subunit IIA [Streptosporangium becharense]MBB2913672.1 PTS system mannitol-specific IIA component [Streptosporangium becharense]MBB5817753.1 PTS system mannitol-specific IIA component [Streptosporangium becharense]
MPETAPLPLDPRAVRLSAAARDREDAIRQCGQALVAVGAVDSPYIDTMLERERSISTYVGEGVAIPHGTLAAKDSVRHDAVSVVRFPDGVDWDGERVTVGIGIAARGDGHVRLLAELAQVLMDPDRARLLREATDVAEVIRLLQPDEEDRRL